MYVISILFLMTNLVLGQFSVTSDTKKIEENAIIQKAALEKADKKMKAMGIDPSLCDSCKDDRKQADKYVNNKALGSIAKINTGRGSCANPSGGNSTWDSIIKGDTDARAMKTNCCADNVDTLVAVQTAYDNCKTKDCPNCQIFCKGRYRSDADQNQVDVCKSNLSNQCTNSYNKLSVKIQKQLDINEKQCKSHSTSKSSLAEILKTLEGLGILAEQIFGHKNNTTNNTSKIYLSCAEKCSNQTGADYTACLCATTQTLSDGSSQRCLPESKCTPDTTCQGTMNTMKEQGYCSGSDCNDILQSCICSKVSETTGVSKVWDPASGTCAPTGSGGGGDNTKKYAGGPTIPDAATTTTPTSTDDAKGTGPVGTGAPTGSSISAPGSGLNKSAPTNDKDKAKFAALSKGATAGQYKPGSNQYGGAYGGPDATAEGGTPSEGAKDIVKQTDSDIWKIIRDIYQSGIDANRFMDPNAIAVKEKANVKKGTKKTKGKKA